MISDTFHRRSLRLSGYDYSQANAFFVTICVAERRCLFGEIQNGMMKLSEAGQIVESEWLKTASLRPNVRLDEFVVMPNQFHGILWLDENREGTARRAPTNQRFGKPVSGSLPTIIGAFKAAVTNQINSLRGASGNSIWQRNYYEHVIRDEKSLNRIREYIINNPLSWDLDRENPGRKGEDGFDRWLASFKNIPPKP